MVGFKFFSSFSCGFLVSNLQSLKCLRSFLPSFPGFLLAFWCPRLLVAVESLYLVDLPVFVVSLDHPSQTKIPSVHSYQTEDCVKKMAYHGPIYDALPSRVGES